MSDPITPEERARLRSVAREHPYEVAPEPWSVIPDLLDALEGAEHQLAQAGRIERLLQQALRRLRHRLERGARQDDVDAHTCAYLVEWIDEALREEASDVD